MVVSSHIDKSNFSSLLGGYTSYCILFSFPFDIEPVFSYFNMTKSTSGSRPFSRFNNSAHSFKSMIENSLWVLSFKPFNSFSTVVI